LIWLHILFFSFLLPSLLKKKKSLLPAFPGLALIQSFNPCPAYAGHGNDCIKQAKDDNACKLACISWYEPGLPLPPLPACLTFALDLCS
jgi:hypothetical protein